MKDPAHKSKWRKLLKKLLSVRPKKALGERKIGKKNDNCKAACVTNKRRKLEWHLQSFLRYTETQLNKNWK